MRVKIFYGWWIVVSCFSISFLVSGLIFYGFTAFFEPLVREFGWSHAQVSFASSLRGIEMGILAPLIGFLVDRFGSRRLMLSGMIILGAGFILLSYTQSLVMFYGAMIFIAFGAGGCTGVVTMTAVSHWFRKNIGKALAIMTSGFGASGLLLPAIVGLIDVYGWRDAVIILGFTVWIIGIPLSLVIRDSPEKYGEMPDGIPSHKGVDSAISSKPPENIPKKSYWDILKDGSFMLLNLAETIRFMVLASVIVHIMPHLSVIGISRSRAGFIAASIPIISIIGRFVFGWFGDRFSKGHVMILAYFLMTIGMVGLAFTHLPDMSSLFLFLFLFFFPLGLGGLSVLRGTILLAYYDKRNFGSMLGIMMGFSAVGGIIGPTFTGWVFDISHDYHLVWIGFCAMLIICILLIMKFKTKVPVTGIIIQQTEA